MQKIEEHIIDDVLNNQATEDEAREVARWFATDEGGEYLSQRIACESISLDDNKADDWLDHSVPSDKMRSKLLKQISSKQKHFRTYWAAAVIIPFLLLGGTVAFMADRLGMFAPIAYEEFYVPNGEQLQVVLQDGTKVQLNSDTRLRFPKKFGLFNRKVELQGEGYFTVEKEANRPFIVDLDGVGIKVTGTKFNVKAYPNESDVFVLLDEGGVSIEDAKAKEFKLNPGDRACYNRLSGSCSITKPSDPVEYTAWRQSHLNFNRTPLREVLSILNRQYDAYFTVQDSALLETRFTLSTTKVNLQDILSDIEQISRIRFINQKERNYLILSEK